MKHLRFMGLAETMAKLSKDRSTKVGSVALDDTFNVLSVGYNGFPKGVNDDVEERHLRPLKYLWSSHSEENLVAQAAYKGISLRDSTVLVTSLFPCCTCSRLLVQSGVKRVIATDPDTANNPTWVEQAEVSKQIFKEGGIEVVYARLNGEGVWETYSPEKRG